MGKQGPWGQYPKRMRQMRARAFALRDVFPDVLRGLPVAEELMDTPTEKHMGPADVVKPATWPDDLFAARAPARDEAPAGARPSPPERQQAHAIVAKAETKHPN
jgi:hypothetical protein